MMEYLEYPIDNRLVFKAEVPKEKVLKFKGMLHSNLPYYSENSIRHPAKMSVLLTRWILQRFTREGETVIDPMSGISTTLLEAVNMNRNCIAVEFEKKFVDWTNENIKLLNKNKPLDSRGEGIVLRGDSRNLTDILNKQADKIVFSPPYCGSEAFQDQDFTLHSTKVNPTSRKISEQKYGKDADAVVMSPPFASSPRAGNKDKDEFWKDQEQRHNRKFTKSKKILDSMHYSNDPDNIGNLPKGDIDAVITSPPYADTPVISYTNVDITKWAKKQLKEKGYIEFQGKKYTEDEWRKLNHGRIDGRTMKGMEKGIIGYENVDTIITSPPFSQANRGGGIAKKGYKGKHGKDEHLHLRHERQLTENKNNISNLPHGEIDAIVTSPPHANTISSNKKEFERIARLVKEGKASKELTRKYNDWLKNKSKNQGCQGHWGSSYSENSENIGNLSKGNIDTIITSPPYEGAMESSRHAKSSLAKIKHNVSAYTDFNSRNSQNIGHKKGKSYLSEMKKVYDQCFSVLKTGGLAVLVTKNFVRNYKMVRLDIDTILLMESCNFKLIDRYFRAIDKPSFWILNYRKQCKKKGVSDPTAHFEDVLVFRKVTGGLTHG